MKKKYVPNYDLYFFYLKENSKKIYRFCILIYINKMISKLPQREVS